MYCILTLAVQIVFGCTLFALVVLEMFLEPDWSPPVAY